MSRNYLIPILSIIGLFLFIGFYFNSGLSLGGLTFVNSPSLSGSAYDQMVNDYFELNFTNNTGGITYLLEKIDGKRWDEGISGNNFFLETEINGDAHWSKATTNKYCYITIDAKPVLLQYTCNQTGSNNLKDVAYYTMYQEPYFDIQHSGGYGDRWEQFYMTPAETLTNNYYQVGGGSATAWTGDSDGFFNGNYVSWWNTGVNTGMYAIIKLNDTFNLPFRAFKHVANFWWFSIGRNSTNGYWIPNTTQTNYRIGLYDSSVDNSETYKQYSIFYSEPTIFNKVGTCSNDTTSYYIDAGNVLSCSASSNILNVTITPNANVTNAYYRINGIVKATSPDIYIYNSSSGEPTDTDLFIHLTNESGTWNYQTDGSCCGSETAWNSGIYNYTAIKDDGTNIVLWLIEQHSSAQYIVLQNDTIPSGETTTESTTTESTTTESTTTESTTTESTTTESTTTESTTTESTTTTTSPVTTTLPPYRINCNSTNIGAVSCGGDGFKYVLTCVNNSAVYQWSNQTTYCNYGCYNGTCISVNITSPLNCYTNQTICGGINNRFVIPCGDDGNWNASTDSWTYCNFTCKNGYCLVYPTGSPTGICSPGTAICQNNRIIYCRLSNVSTNAYTWDVDHPETCKYGCSQQYYDYGTNATCLSTEPDIFGIKLSTFGEWTGVIGLAFNQAFPTILDRTLIFILISVSVGGFVAFKIDLNFGIISSIIIMILGSFISWTPFYIPIIYGIIGFMLIMSYKGERNE